MFHPDQILAPEAVALVAPRRTGACLVPGCPCKDARIISPRRAAFVSAVAHHNGETADRSIAPDPSWRLPRAADTLEPGLAQVGRPSTASESQP